MTRETVIPMRLVATLSDLFPVSRVAAEDFNAPTTLVSAALGNIFTSPIETRLIGVPQIQYLEVCTHHDDLNKVASPV